MRDFVEDFEEKSLVEAATHEPARERLIAAGRAHAATLTWDRTAELTDETIGRLLCSGGRA